MNQKMTSSEFRDYIKTGRLGVKNNKIIKNELLPEYEKQLNNSEFVIGIDPDLHKSGVAIYDKTNKKLVYVQSLYIWDLFKLLLLYKENSFIRLEYAPLINCSSWHGGGRGGIKNVGKSHAVCIIIDEFLLGHGFKYEKLKPSGYSKTFDNIEYFKKTTGWADMTNKDSRSAVAMILGY